MLTGFSVSPTVGVQLGGGQLGGGTQAAVAQAQASKIARHLKTAPARLAAADEARDENNILLASTIYLRLALSGVDTPQKDTAKDRLRGLQKKGDKRVDKLDRKLKNFDEAMSQQQPIVLENFHNLFRQYEEMARQFEKVPVTGTKIKSHVAKLRAKPEYARILKEPEAARLWKIGVGFEGKQEYCCAYHVYKEAAKHQPAPSAILARDRLALMDQHEWMVAEAKRCADLQWCHKMYQRAERLTKSRPDRAREIFVQILNRSPATTVIGQAARDRLAMLN